MRQDIAEGESEMKAHWGGWEWELAREKLWNHLGVVLCKDMRKGD